MTDYNHYVELSRDQVADMLIDNEQTAYVLAEYADNTQKGTMNFDNFVDSLDSLSLDRLKALREFCRNVAEL